MKTSKRGYDLIKEFEGLHRLRADGLIAAYIDPVGIPTIGWGAIRMNGRAVRMSDVIDRKLADQLLVEEVSGFEKDVEALVKVALTQNQFDALVSFCFNVGAGAFAGSSVRRKLNAGDYRGAADGLLAWNKGDVNSDGDLDVLPGLTRRREAERALFLAQVASEPAPKPDEPKSSGRPYAPCPVPLPWTHTLEPRPLPSTSVYYLQCALIGLGYLAKPKDGELVGDVFNEHVEYAVREFQKQYMSDDDDGIVGPRTRAAIERALTKARKPKDAPKPTPAPTDSSIATLRCIDGQWHEGAWSGLKVLSLGVGNETFHVASGARGVQNFRRPEDERSSPGNLEPIPQGKYRIEPIEFADGKGNYEGSWGHGLGPVWVGLSAEFSDDRNSFGGHLDANIGSSPGSAGCVVFRDVADLKRFVAALRKFDPKHLVVDWKL